MEQEVSYWLSGLEFKLLFRITNKEDPDQTASLEAQTALEAVWSWSGSALFVQDFLGRQVVFEILEHLAVTNYMQTLVHFLSFFFVLKMTA